MEEGSLRCDANVSLRPAGSDELGTKTELKNMNSFRFIERGIEAEIERQAAILDAGGRVEQETLHFDPRIGALTPLRSKEYSHDYRYFPEPDLVPLEPTEEMIAAARAALPELPAERRERYLDELGLADEAATQLAFDADLGAYFERTLAAADRSSDAPTIANWVTGELVARLREAGDDDSRPRRLAGHARGAGEARRDGGAQARSRTGAARQVLATPGRRGRRPGRDRRARGPRRDRGVG